MEDIKIGLSAADLEVIGDALTGYGADRRLVMKFSMLESCGGKVWMTSDGGEESPTVMKNHEPIPSRPIEIDSKISMMSAPVEPQPAPILDKEPEVGPTRPAGDEPLMEIKIGIGLDAAKPVEDETVGSWDTRVPRPTRYVPPVVEKKPVVEVTPQMQAKADELTESLVGPQPYPVNRKPRTPAVPKPVEPSFDHDERCVDCGGFSSNNPHSDPKMNCNCVIEPEPELKPAQHDSTGGAWSTGAAQAWNTQG